MPPLQVTTNHLRRPLLLWHELTPDQQKEFDYLDDPERFDAAEFFIYKGCVYILDDFMTLEGSVPGHFTGWDGYLSESFFSGIVVKIDPNDENAVIIGYYCS